MTEHRIKLINESKIFKIGSTKIDQEGFDEFIEFIEAEIGETATKLRDIKANSLSRKHPDVDNVAEIGGRMCYQSYTKGRDTEEYFDNILESGHGSVIEHGTVNLALTGISRSLTHQLIRHRPFNISEMSQRFVGANEKSSVWNFVVPVPFREKVAQNDEATIRYLLDCALKDIDKYLEAQEIIRSKYSGDYSGFKLTKIVNESAREFLPSWVETRALWTGNPRALRHVLESRGSEHADQQIFGFSHELLDVLTKQMRILSMSDMVSDGKNITTKYGKV